jgi:LDH2 family malate/lactate/ureidoglycolate dehydrogenase
MSNGAERIQIVYAESMKQFCAAACKKVHLSQEHAELLADTLVKADLRGVHSHGVARLPAYIVGYQVGGVNPRPVIRIVRESGATAVMDGDDGMGLIVSHPAMALAIDKAAKYGIGAVTVRKSNHCGMLAYWSMMALKHDMIGYATTNSSPTMAPWGGITLSCGNNPVSYAIPANKEPPLVLDIAMSVVAKGKIREAALKNKPIPPGWAMDKDGVPTSDVETALGGILMPMAGHKGYGLALVNDVLSGVLSGGRFGVQIPEAPVGGGAEVMGYCHFFMALDIKQFTTVEEFKRRVDLMVHMMKSSRLAKGQARIYLPGEIEFETERQRTKDGIPYAKELVNQLKRLADKLEVDTNFQ